MAVQIDIHNIGREREFAKGCVVWIIRKRNPNLSLEFLDVKEDSEDSDNESDESNEIDVNQTLASYERIYEAVNSYAVDNKEVIEAKYRSFFTEAKDLIDPHTKNFCELVCRYAHDLQKRPFSYEVIIAFCAHVSIFGYLSYQAKKLQEVVLYAISSIAYVLKYHDFNESKYNELSHQKKMDFDSPEYIFSRDIIFYIMQDYYSAWKWRPCKKYASEKDRTLFTPAIENQVKKLLDNMGPYTHVCFENDFDPCNISNKAFQEVCSRIVKEHLEEDVGLKRFVKLCCVIGNYAAISFIYGARNAPYIAIRILYNLVQTLKADGRFKDATWSEIHMLCADS
ncbi:hypothetical protein HNY73_009140 [Argiope bruennichi]|uniref:Uncharacterized protein n=1 Tax=Argiope bruennichi TaxID=94029 RepID=A0A8T0F8N1_ARGBR|nr:hypothetical protein HNY73_009140 [Argiope bruennichi]